MKYASVFEKMPEALLECISKQSWASPEMNKGTELPVLLTDPKQVGRLYANITSPERRTLKLVVSAFGCSAFSWELLEKKAFGRMAGAEVMLGLTGLQRYGIIAVFRKTWGEKLYVLPEDGFMVWHSLLFPDASVGTFNESRQQTELEEKEADGDPRGLAQQLFHFLVKCSRFELPLTAKGVLHRRLLQKLSEPLTLPNEVLHKTGLAYAFSDVYEPHIAVMLDLSMRLSILVPSQDRLTLEQSALIDWLARTYEEQQAILYEKWEQLYMPSPVWLQHVIVMMRNAGKEQWHSVDGVVRWLTTNAIDLEGYEHDLAGLKQELLDRWIQPLHAFHWIKLAESADGSLWFQWMIHTNSEIAEKEAFTSMAAGNSVYVQPDFELLVPPVVPLSVEWEIAAFADLHSSDTVRVYKITKESFQRACEKGKDCEEIIAFLQQHAYYEIAEPMLATLRQWAQQIGKLYFAEVTLLRCKTSELADALERSDKCKPYIQERVGSSDFIVQLEHLNVFRNQLVQMGYYLGHNAEMNAVPYVQKAEIARAWKTMSAKSQKGSHTPVGLFYSRDSLQFYELDAALPQIEDLYPNLQDIPSLWLKEFRDYHGSTRKEMIRKAIEWKSYLRLRKEGHERLIVPRALFEQRAGWTVIGMEEHQEISLNNEDWEEMKLILPGVNDE